MPVRQGDLFGVAAALPEGFVYAEDFVTPEEEAALIEVIRALPLAEAQYKEYTARRRTVSYGFQYDFDRNALDEAPPLPPILFPLRDRVARWLGVGADAFVHALVSEYRPGTPLGWHRDVPDFEAIAGVSLASPARMRLRPYRPGEKARRVEVIDLELAPRSIYGMRGPARWSWQHAVAPVRELRYSITFRTARERAQKPRSG